MGQSLTRWAQPQKNTKQEMAKIFLTHCKLKQCNIINITQSETRPHVRGMRVIAASINKVKKNIQRNHYGALNSR